MTTNRTCNTCGGGLDDSGPFPSYRTRLITERMPNLSNTECDVHVTPSLPFGQYDFCGRKCLTEWLEKDTQ